MKGKALSWTSFISNLKEMLLESEIRFSLPLEGEGGAGGGD